MRHLSDFACWPYNEPMNKKLLLALFGVGAAGVAFAAQAGAEDGSDIALEKRGVILGTMAHLKSVKLQDASPIPAYIVNNDNVQRADEETARFIIGLSRNCVQDFWGE
jgi:malic enzyme